MEDDRTLEPLRDVDPQRNTEGLISGEISKFEPHFVVTGQLDGIAFLARHDRVRRRAFGGFLRVVLIRDLYLFRRGRTQNNRSFRESRGCWDADPAMPRRPAFSPRQFRPRRRSASPICWSSSPIRRFWSWSASNNVGVGTALGVK